MVAEFESNLARMRTPEGMKVARAKGRLRGKQPKLSPRQEAHLVALHGAGEHTISELEELFSITRSTVYRALALRPSSLRDLSATLRLGSASGVPGRVGGRGGRGPSRNVRQRRSGSRDPARKPAGAAVRSYLPVPVLLVVLAVALLRWSMARSSAPIISICSGVNAGRCAHTARHLRSRTRSAAEKYGSSNSSPLASPIPESVARSLAALDHPLPPSARLTRHPG
jgi:hypothetical protein